MPFVRWVSVLLVFSVLHTSSVSTLSYKLAPLSQFQIDDVQISKVDRKEPTGVGHSFRCRVLTPALFLMLVLLAGCSSMSSEERARYITDEIGTRIEKKEWGNSYDVSSLADDRWDNIEELIDSGKSRSQIATLLGLKDDKRSLFIQYGILVDGNRNNEDVKRLKTFIEKLPPSHIPAVHTVLMGLSFSRIYDHDKSGRYYFIEGRIIGFVRNFLGENGVKLINLAHEWGHAVDFYLVSFLKGKWYWTLHLLFSWGDDAYASEYGGATHWEDFAEIYELWMTDSLKFLNKQSGGAAGKRFSSRVLLWKTLMVLRHFVIEREGKYFLRAYRHGRGSKWPDKWTLLDIEVDIGDPSDLDLEHLLKVRDALKEADGGDKKVSFRFAPSQNQGVKNPTLLAHVEPIESSS